ncbi:hypothetical protein F5Y15DRAFT_404854 [Xylariaceae sp. FL0016]|nr:hypothetical protein F5Y15DRAFT_404854 [Xylariaceae sp. FL0016]
MSRDIPPYPKAVYPSTDEPAPGSAEDAFESGMSDISTAHDAHSMSPTFHLLELELELTRGRLDDLRAIVHQAPIENVRDAVQQLADGFRDITHGSPIVQPSYPLSSAPLSHRFEAPAMPSYPPSIPHEGSAIPD